MPDRLLSIADAATRVRRSRSNVELWIKDGLLDVVRSTTAGGQVRRYVHEKQLLEVLRAKLQANPARRKPKGS